jgi:hypothetical protein
MTTSLMLSMPYVEICDCKPDMEVDLVCDFVLSGEAAFYKIVERFYIWKRFVCVLGLRPSGPPQPALAVRLCLVPLSPFGRSLILPPPALLDSPVGLAVPFGASDNSAVIGSGLSGHTPCS